MIALCERRRGCRIPAINQDWRSDHLLGNRDLGEWRSLKAGLARVWSRRPVMQSQSCSFGLGPTSTIGLANLKMALIGKVSSYVGSFQRANDSLSETFSELSEMEESILKNRPKRTPFSVLNDWWRVPMRVQ